MEHMTVNDIIKATGGTLLCGDAAAPVEHLSIDSRTMKGRDLFVPLVGAKVDAHDYIGQAIANGAAAVLTSVHHTAQGPASWIRVEDTRKALQSIGAYYRNRLTIPLIGITGSVGKTTTREMVAAALEPKYRVYKTPGNSNSQVGLPITLSEIRAQDQIGVIEMGMSEPGEMEAIARIARVDAAVIINIDVAHIEQLGSRERIREEKLHIQDGMAPKGTLFLNGDDELLNQVSAWGGRSTVRFGTGDNCQYQAADIRLERGKPRFTVIHGQEQAQVRLNVPGAHLVSNAMAALAVAGAYGVDLAVAAKGLERFAGIAGRQKLYESRGVTVIDDSYNASPASMKASLEVLASMAPGAQGNGTEMAEKKGVSGGRRIAVLADMKELGPDAVLYHRQMGEYIAAHPLELAVLYGNLAAEIGRGIREAGGTTPCAVFDDREELARYLEETLRAGDAVLFKGSNSMKLGEVAKRVTPADS